MKEFDIISKYFGPLSNKPLIDDVVSLPSIATDKEWVISEDAFSEGIHFFSDYDPKLLAKRTLRASLSDLAAAGATAYGYTLSLIIPQTTTQSWLEAFSQGLAEDNTQFGVSLMGGDTVTHNSTVILSYTVYGYKAKCHSLNRSNAQAGDLIFVSGTIGKGLIGLTALKNPQHPWITPLSNDVIDQSIHHYHQPTPQLSLGQHILPFAHAAIDISDGLIQDLNHICTYSQLGASLYIDDIPFNITQRELYPYLLSGGDDYELLFTAPPTTKKDIIAVAKKLGITISIIGSMGRDVDVVLYDASGSRLNISTEAYQHRII